VGQPIFITQSAYYGTDRYLSVLCLLLVIRDLRSILEPQIIHRRDGLGSNGKNTQILLAIYLGYARLFRLGTQGLYGDHTKWEAGGCCKRTSLA